MWHDLWRYTMCDRVSQDKCVMLGSVKQFHKSKEARRLRELHLAEMKRRKLAAKIGRDIRGWWSKIEKVISYKQKLMADEERQAAMNKQLVVLVQQTEKYTESLAHNIYSDDEDEDDDTSDGTETGESEMEDTTDDLVTSDSDTFTSGSEDGRRRRKRRKRRGFRLTIEEALASENTFVRKSKKKIIDYSRMRLPSDEFYGENTASDVSGSDGSYSPGDDGSENDSDDDSTLQQAMHEELKERQQDATSTFLADPEELRKLREEVTLNIDEVIERLRQEGEEEIAPMDVESFQPDTPTMANKSDSKHVHFSDTVQETLLSPRQPDITNPDEDDVSASKSTHIIALDPVGKYDADDDADASDVEDYNDSADQKSDEELDAQEPEADDESIIAQKGFVPRDASTAEELALLQQEGELPIEELRKIYSNRDEHIEQATEIGKARSKENHTEKAVQVLVASEDDNATEMAEDSDEFEPPAMPEVDDETTIEAEEKLGRDMSYEDEMSLLKRESEIPIEELRAMYTEAAEAKYDDQAKNEENIETYHPSEEEASLQYSSSTTPTTKIHADETMSEDEGTEEYEFIESEAIDDECTIEAEERLGRDMTYEEEIALLKQESEMSVEELKARYAKMEAENVEQPQQNETILLNLSGDDEDGAGEEFEPIEAEGVDDETTLEAEEVLGREMSYEEEMAILKRDSEIPIEELVAMYRRIQTQEESGQEDSEDENSKRSNANDPISLVGELLGQGFDDEEDFVPNEADAMDDETTIEAEEKLGHEISHEEEIALLKRESGMPVEELRKMYAKLYEENESGGNNNDVEEGDNDLSEKSTKRRREVKEVYEGAKKPKVEDAGDTADDGLAALNALEASAERAKRTLASRPFLLSGWVKLRLYQQVGLNWLVSLQSRRLNGILADGKFPWCKYGGSC